MKKTDLTPLERARADLRAKEAAIKALEREMEAIRAAIGYMEGLYEVDGDKIAVVDAGTAIAKAEGELQKAGTEIADVGKPKTKEYIATDFCVKYVEAHGASTGSELHHAFLAAGHTLAGKDRNAQMVTLAGYLKRTKALKYHKEYGRWWFVDRPYPVRRVGFFTAA